MLISGRATASALLFSLMLAGTVTAHAQDTTAVRALDGLQPKIVAWRRDLHQHPELATHEVRTAKLVADQLRALGLQPRTGIAQTGVTAILKGGKPGPRIALRADMDALPVTEQTGLPFASKVASNYRGQPVGVMHACGHDAHVAMLLGVASAGTARGIRDDIWRHLADDWKPRHLETICTQEITLDGLPGVFNGMLSGQSFGRTLVRTG